MKRLVSRMTCAAVLASSLMLTACIPDIDFEEIGEIYSESEDIARPDMGEQTHSSMTEQDISEHTYTSGASRLSQIDGELEITRRQRENEVPMGDGNWTILVYMCGSDLESGGYAATIDLVEAIEGEYSSDVTLAVQTGGSDGWYDDIIAANRLQRYVVQEDDISLVGELPNADMGAQQTLTEFLEWGIENYPAENMGVIFWNHGGGSISGICFDELYDFSSLSLRELDGAFNSVYDKMTDKFTFIGFDACLMSTLETANVLVPYAEYMYASEETEPGGGWDYTAIMNYLADNPDADGEMLGAALCDSYYRHCEESGSEDNVTLSVVDLREIDPLLISFNETAKRLYESPRFSSIVRAASSADNFGGNNRTEGYTNMVDMGGILENIADYIPSASDTLAKLDDAVVYSVNGALHRNASGLAMYYPLAVQGSEELSIFAEVCPSAYYLAFVDKVAYGATGMDAISYDNSNFVEDCEDIWDFGYSASEDYGTNTDSFTGIDDCTLPVEGVFFDEDGIYNVAMSDFSDLAYASCSLFLWDTDDTMVYLGEDDDVIYDSDSMTIQDNFDGSWLSLDDGTPLPIVVVDQTEDYSLYTCEVLLNGEYTNLRIEYDWNREEFSVIGAWGGIDPETGMAAKETTPLENGDIIQPIYYYYGDDFEDYFGGNEYTVNGDIEISYQYLPSGDYYYSITLYDIYGNWFFMPEVMFTIEEDGSLSYYPEDLEGSDYYLDDYNFDDYFSEYDMEIIDDLFGDFFEW